MNEDHIAAPGAVPVDANAQDAALRDATSKEEIPIREAERILLGSTDHRILRRLRPATKFADAPAEERVFTGVIIDTETTSLDVGVADVIELGGVKFRYTQDGQPLDVIETFSRLREPASPIPEDVTRITGISQEMVQGRKIEDAEVESFLEGVNLIIAHNASYDRPIVERFWTVFKRFPWACSIADVPWRDHGRESANLGVLLGHCGLFHDAHRALDDCQALVHVLAHPLKDNGRPALATLLENARKPKIRVWAAGAPFAAKDALKSAGYHWCDGTSGPHRAWWRDVPEDEADAEIARLKRDVFGGRDIKLPMRPITPRERFSLRVR